MSYTTSILIECICLIFGLIAGLAALNSSKKHVTKRKKNCTNSVIEHCLAELKAYQPGSVVRIELEMNDCEYIDCVTLDNKIREHGIDMVYRNLFDNIFTFYIRTTDQTFEELCNSIYVIYDKKSKVVLMYINEEYTVNKLRQGLFAHKLILKSVEKTSTDNVYLLHFK